MHLLFQRRCQARRRRRVMAFLLDSSLQLRAPLIVKYTALSFTDRFLPSLPCFLQRNTGRLSWLLNPLRESNLQLFALVSIWISSKIHDTRPLAVKSLKSLGDNVIVDQHFTTRDFAEAELVFMEVFRFDIGASHVAYHFLEGLYLMTAPDQHQPSSQAKQPTDQRDAVTQIY